MKTILRLALSLALIGAVLAFPLQAAAEAVRVPVTAVMTFTGEPYEDPQARLWYTPNAAHWRNDIQTFEVDSSDSRLVGWMLMTQLNGNWINYEDGGWLLHIWAQSIITADPEFQDVLWRCPGGNYFYTPEGMEVDFVCQGEGENKGLMLKLTGGLMEGSVDQYLYEGSILETGSY